MAFSKLVKENLFVKCGRYCCLCHKFCGTKIEAHHIIPEEQGGSNAESNGIPLCFDCHAEVISYNEKHPKGNKFSRRELRSHKNNWFNKVNNSDNVSINKSKKKLTLKARKVNRNCNIRMAGLEITLSYCLGSFKNVSKCFFLEFILFNNTSHIMEIKNSRISNATKLFQVHPLAEKNIVEDYYPLKFLDHKSEFSERRIYIERGSSVELAYRYQRIYTKKILNHLLLN
jgi:hypothetical protein